MVKWLQMKRKQKITTQTGSNVSFTTRTALVAVAILMAISVPLSFVPSANADEFDVRIQQIQAEIDAYQSKARALRDQANTLQTVVDGFNNQIAVLQGQINLSQTKYDQLIADIDLNEKKIAYNKDILGKTIADIYVDDKISPLEMLASSKSIGEYIDKQEYRTTVRDRLTEAIDEIKKLKKELEQQKVDVERVLADLKNSQRELDGKRAEQQSILDQTRGDEAAYQQLSAKSEAQKLEVMRQQQAAIEAAMRRNGGGISNILPGDPNKGGYPWEVDCWVDGNAMSHGGVGGNGTDALGYGCRQCVSYTAWKVLQRTGYAPRYWGNANMWPGSARNAGFSTGSTPRANSVGVISAGFYGHVVWIEAVNGDGTVDVSQYNYFNAGGPGWGNYSRMRVSAATYDTYIYF